MYIEETGAGNGDIKVNVEGEDYTAEANYDLDGDGVDDTVTVMTGEGHVAYVDENIDGQADVMQTVDEHGTVVSQARFGAETGDWVGEQPQQRPHDGDPRGEGDSMVMDTPNGDRDVGPATEDTDFDGRADTAIVETGTGTMLVTDVDGDGSADQMVEINDTGAVTIAHHTGEGQWTVIEEGRIDQSGQYTPDPAASGTDDATWTFDEPAPVDRPGAQQPWAVGDREPDSDSVWA